MIRSIFLAAGLLFAGSSAQAIVRIYTPNHSCQYVRSAVQEYGEVILYTSSHVFDRYVSHEGYCYSGTMGRPAWVNTSDSSHCHVGYRCVQDSRGR